MSLTKPTLPFVLGLWIPRLCVAQLAEAPWPKFQHDLRNSGCSEYVGPAQPVVAGWSSFAGHTLGSQIVLGKDGDAYVFWAFTDIEFRIEDARPEYFGWGDDTYPSFSRLERFRADGSRVWGLRVSPWGSPTPCVSSDGRAYIATDDGPYHGGRVYSYTTDGRLLWRSGFLDEIQYTHPTIGPDGVVYHATDGGLFAFAKEGTLLWRYSGIYQFQCPSIGADGTIYLGLLGLFGGGGVVALNPDGSRRWYIEIGGCNGTTLAEDGTIYVQRSPGNSRSDLIALRPDGAARWLHELELLSIEHPAVGSDGVIYLASTYDFSDDERGVLWAVNPNGTRRWTVELPAGTVGPLVVDAASNIYVTYYRSLEPWKTTLISFDANGLERWRFDLGAALAETGPAINAKGQLLIFAQKDGDPEPATRILTLGDADDPQPPAVENRR